ncbi:hypothetical protein ACFYOC_24115 [Nocardiopsis alba]|uniref:hypothetical protein n=1 Tax=Nocardiopsis alba TaxID=53437 RepID=UPI00369388D1
MPDIRVTFPHTDSMGSKRKVGEVYTVSEDEAVTRVDHDKFAQRVERKASTKPQAIEPKKADGK